MTVSGDTSQFCLDIFFFCIFYVPEPKLHANEGCSSRSSNFKYTQKQFDQMMLFRLTKFELLWFNSICNGSQSEYDSCVVKQL